MTTRVFLLLTLAGLTAGCIGPENPPDAKPAPAAEPAAGFGLTVAPAPRAKEDNLLAPEPQPTAPASSDKPVSELVLGKWIRVGHTFLGGATAEFTPDGKKHIRHFDHRDGPRVWTVDAKLSGYTFSPPRYDTDSREVREFTTSIESVSLTELTLVTVERRRLTAEAAKLRATKDKPAAALLAEVSESRHRAFYVRPKN